MQFKDITFERCLKYKDHCQLLLLTATNLERDELLKALTPLPGQKYVIRTYLGSNTYYIGIFGIYLAILVKSGMGTGRAGGAIMTTQKAIDHWSPTTIVMIGIAFGVDRDKQNIGDVLVAEQIIPYDIRREGKDITIYRSEHPPTSILLRDRFEGVGDWIFPLPDGNKARHFICPLLSGEVLIDNKEFRDMLLRSFPKACGGDMEASGVHAAAVEARLDWIVVKAICDFADGRKGENKKSNQLLAVRSAISLSEKVFSIPHSFADLDLQSISIPSAYSIDSKRMENTLSVDKRHLKYLISKNEIDSVFLELSNTIPEEYYDELVTLERMYLANKREERAGVASRGDIQLSYNQVVASLLKLIAEV
ncbi:MAG: hypothetical protein MI974_06375 [Chitinophagales bacterium]|nr:hypothetical protein [Chitinophagales bacterium]